MLKNEVDCVRVDRDCKNAHPYARAREVMAACHGFRRSTGRETLRGVAQARILWL